MSNGDAAWHDSVPQWAKTWVYVGGALVVPILVAGFFMLKDIGYVASPGVKNTEILNRIEKKLDAGIEDMKELVKGRIDWQERLLYVQIETCRAAARAAHDKTQEIRCDYWRR